jgi:hypothetical protein
MSNKTPPTARRRRHRATLPLLAPVVVLFSAAHELTFKLLDEQVRGHKCTDDEDEGCRACNVEEEAEAAFWLSGLFADLLGNHVTPFGLEDLRQQLMHMAEALVEPAEATDDDEDGGEGGEELPDAASAAPVRAAKPANPFYAAK